jgi:ferritin-like metal-binding protein YciE
MSLRKIAMSKKTKMLQDLFHDTLKDVYFAEKKILTTLPKMKKAAQSEELAAAFEKHHGETEGHVQRLEQVFKIIGEKPQAKTCDAILGIVDEGAEIMEEYKGSPALDAGLPSRGTGRRALRDVTLWHPHRLGGEARDRKSGNAALEDA